MKRLKNILLLLLVAVVTVGCDMTIHEYPDTNISRVTVPVTLNLDFNTDMPIHEKQEHSRTRTGLTSEDFDLRYIVNIYRKSEWRQIKGEEFVARHVFTKDDISEWNNSVTMTLEVGNYDFVVWSDYVDAGSEEDKYYDTSTISFIKPIGTYTGSNDYHDTYVGYHSAQIGVNDLECNFDVYMTRPMAKYRFISTDLDAFISRMLALKKKQLEEARAQEEANRGEGDDNRGGDDTKGDTKVEVNLEDYYVEFIYEDYSTITFDALRNGPAAPAYSQMFTSSINKISETEAEIGFDYLFMDIIDTEVKISLNVKDKSGASVGGVNGFFVKLSRGKLTEVRGKFLTMEEQGGVGINPDFEDEWTFIID